MLEIDMEFRKGILFVRLTGDFSESSCRLLDDKLNELINGNKVRFVTFNVSGLNNIDLDAINTMLRYNKTLSRIEGKAIICGVDNDLVKWRIHNSQVPYYMFETSDELAAINYINLGG